VQVSPVFNEYPDEEELILTAEFADLKSNPPIYDTYESESDQEQFSHPEILVTNPEDPLADLEIHATVTEVHATDPEAPEISYQEVTGVSFPQQKNRQKIFVLQQKQPEEVFIFNFSDPFSDYLESLSSFDVRVFMLNEDWLLCPMELHISILWFLAFFVPGLRDLQANKIIVWLHWKHAFT